MLDPRDRRDLACLGLMVLVYGLLVAPVVHAVVGHGGGLGGGAAHVHGHGPGEHTHPNEPGDATPGKKRPASHAHQHPSGSVEHLLAVATTWSAPPPPAVQWVSWAVERQHAPGHAPGTKLRPTAMPQGP
ncbi:hypothetical protein JGU66_29390 [Myxococcaceae bacterium JPH2]|nr:hypothetical protein [Myxococcaceae bacterium JPH2]